MATLRLRVFVSSPDDLAVERGCARKVIESLSGSEVGGWQIELDPMLWETDSPPIVGQKAQQAIDYYFGKASDTDIYIGMLWTTLGSPVILKHRRYSSGTLYEFEDAYARSRRAGKPHMLMYHCERASDADPAKVQQVTDFFSSFRGEFPAYEGNPLRFDDSQEFAERLRRDLVRVLEKIVEQRKAEQADALQQAMWSAPPEKGRATLLRALVHFLRNYDDIFGEGREHDDAFPVSFARVSTSPQDGPAPTPPKADGSLLEAYESAGRRVLFVGEAGSGKTFAMLRLMQQLLDRAKDHPELPLPVYLNLASWSPLSVRANQNGGFAKIFDRKRTDQSDIDEWVVDELVRRYSIPRRAARQLVANRQIIFCLDGLDEIGHRADEAPTESLEGSARKQWQNDCVCAINRLLEDASVELVLCGRRSLLDQLETRLDVPCWLQIQPLDPKLCAAYLERWANLDGLRAALQQSPALAARVQNPLFMRMMSVAYRGMHVQPIAKAATKPEFQWQSHLIVNYIQQSLSLMPDSTRGYFSSQVPRHLSWLAAHAEPDFLVEDMQPSMLFPPPPPAPDGSHGSGGAREEAPVEETELEHALPMNESGANRSYRTYRLTADSLLALALSLCAAIPLGIAIGIEWSASIPVGESIVRGGILAVSALLITFAFGLPAFSSGRWWAFGGLLGAGFAIVRGLTVGLSSPQGGTGGTALEGLEAALGTWPFSTIVFSLLGYQMFSALREHRVRYRSKAGIRWYEIQPLESLDWRWFDSRDRWRGGWLGLVVGPVAGAIFWALFGQARGLAFGIIITAFVCMFSGFLGTGVRVSLEPNQGILRSCRHALLTTLVFTTGSVLACAVSYGMVHGTLEAVVNSVLALATAFVCLAFGAIPVVRHVCLGHMLHARGALPSWWSWYPWSPTVQFLNDMVRCKMLRRTAGGYSFRHGVIRDHFVRMWHGRFAREDVDGEPAVRR